MTILTWYTGIVVNFLLLLILSSVLASCIANDKRRTTSSEVLLNGSLSLFGLIISSTGTLLLYLQQGTIQQDLTNTDTIFPFFLWMGYSIAVIGFLGIILSPSHLESRQKHAIQSGAAIIFILLSFGMNDYITFWNDGAVLVVFQNSIADMLGIFFSMMAAIAGLSFALFQRLSFVESKRDYDNPIEERTSSSLLLSALFFTIQFAIPRATIESVTNPISVKVIGLIIIIGYAYYLSDYIKTVPCTKLSPEPTEIVGEISAISVRDIRILAIGTAVVAIYAILMWLDIPILSIHEKISLGLPIFYIGDWRGDALFIDPVGFFLPIIAATTIIIVILFRYRTWKFPDSSNLFVIFLSAILSFVISLAIYLTSSRIPTDYQPRFSVFPFIVSALVSWMAMIQISKREIITRWNGKQFNDSRAEYLCPILVYSGNTFAALLFDLAVAESPFGVIQIGGAGFIDGLIWAPLLSAVILSICIVLYKLLWNSG